MSILSIAMSDEDERFLVASCKRYRAAVKRQDAATDRMADPSCDWEKASRARLDAERECDLQARFIAKAMCDALLDD